MRKADGGHRLVLVRGVLPLHLRLGQGPAFASASLPGFGRKKTARAGAPGGGGGGGGGLCEKINVARPVFDFFLLAQEKIPLCGCFKGFFVESAVWFPRTPCVNHILCNHNG